MSDSYENWLVRASETQRRVRAGDEDVMLLSEYRKLRAEARKKLDEEQAPDGDAEAKPKAPKP